MVCKGGWILIAGGFFFFQFFLLPHTIPGVHNKNKLHYFFIFFENGIFLYTQSRLDLKRKLIS